MIPGLRARALVKCAQQINWYVAELEQSVERLQRGLDRIRHAAQSIATLNNKEEEESRMLGRPVFRDLSIDVIGRMFAQIAESYDAELTVKRCVVSDFKGKSEEAIEVIKKLTVSMDDWTGNTESSTVQEERTTESTESYLQVHITAWMLNTEVDDDLVNQSLEMMTQDAKSS